MIPLEKLRAIRTVTTHANCPDGVAAAMVVHDALPEAEIRFVQHGTAELAALRPAPGQLFVDFSPPRERAAEFVAAGAICLDHHQTSRDVVESFGELGVYADEPGVGGATLAFREVWLPLLGPNAISRLEIAPFATLAGIRDTWQTKSPAWREACAQAEALRFWPTKKLLDAPFDRAPGGVSDLLRIGSTLIEKRDAETKRTIAEAWRFEVAGVRVVTFQGLHTSDVAEALGAEADLVVGWHYRLDGGRQRVAFSCRARGGFDASALAVAYGGGGRLRRRAAAPAEQAARRPLERDGARGIAAPRGGEGRGRLRVSSGGNVTAPLDIEAIRAAADVADKGQYWPNERVYAHEGTLSDVRALLDEVERLRAENTTLQALARTPADEAVLLAAARWLNDGSVWDATYQLALTDAIAARRDGRALNPRVAKSAAETEAIHMQYRGGPHG